MKIERTPLAKIIPSNNPPMDELIHYGVKGMRWGIRKKDDSSSSPEHGSGDLQVKLKNGDVITLNNKPSGPMAKLIDRMIPGRSKENFSRQNLHIKDKEGNRVGELYAFSDAPKTLHIAWIGVKDKYRGHGYATASMRAVVDNAKKQGFKEVSLQAVNESEDAVHIYKKMGFEEDNSKEEPMEGLTNMKLKL